WVLHIPTGTTDIEQMPTVKQHLAPFRAQLEQRTTPQKWFESQPEHTEHAKLAMKPKIVCMHGAGRPKFSLDRSGAHVSAEGYVIPIEDYFLMGSLNSKLYRLLMLGTPEPGQEAGHVQIAQIESLPFPLPTVEQRGFIGQNSEFCMKLSMERKDFREYICGEIQTNLGPKDKTMALSQQLDNWHMLDIISFREAVRQHFGHDVPEDMVQAWEHFLDEGKYQLSRMNLDLERAERQIDAEVYDMFCLTEEEVELMDKM
ncbi:MAG: TaqI-like C-terminal specificity domain-containing protein, partial [Burkholderiaceae bacterium]|nr:TaqI-like C-terminal specificity domain-containing protein [Burkholderiaceae bacterium]